MRRLYGPALPILLAITLCGAAFAASPARAPIGVVLFATAGHASFDATLTGATIYDGDRLQTESDGTIRARLGTSQISLLPGAAVDVHGNSSDFSADLISGTIFVSIAAGQSFRLTNGVNVRASTPQKTVIRATAVNRDELLLSALSAAVQVYAGGIMKTVKAGESYRVVNQNGRLTEDHYSGSQPPGKEELPPEDPPQPGTTPNPPGHNGFNRILMIALPVATGVGIWRALISPCSP